MTKCEGLDGASGSQRKRFQVQVAETGPPPSTGTLSFHRIVDKTLNVRVNGLMSQ